jgi:ATP-dependent Clp protease ATP-binding subunit ClpA
MKLDSLTSQIYLVAMNEAKIQNHEFVMPEHVLYAISMFDDGRDILVSSGGNSTAIKADLQRYFEDYAEKREDFSAMPWESVRFTQLFENADIQAENAGKQEVTIGELLCSLIDIPESFAAYIMKKNGVERLAMLKYISHDYKERLAARNSSQSPVTDNAEKEKHTELLKAYAVNLTELAKKGKIDNLIGREDELARAELILCRRKKNNLLFVGDAGVGKTTVVEGLARKIVRGDVAEDLKDAQIFEIDMAKIVAGTKYRGDFEERLINVLTAAEKIKNAIVYFDEMHNIVGMGAVSGGALDASGILKPYFVRGDLRFIGATTFEEYKKHIEKDSALTRRFQKVDIEEPNLQYAVRIINGVKDSYEKFHGVTIASSVAAAACELSAKYINDRKLPDKAIDVIDEAMTAVKIRGGKSVTKADIEKVVSRTANVPEENVSEAENSKLKSLAETLKKSVFGQDKAVEIVRNAVVAARSGLNNPEKPTASLLFVGPTGVGKTEIAKRLAAALGVKLIRFDMSEYQEQHSVARLIGSPPGYVGFENGGLLTDSVRRTPNCVLLLDEIEKAHPDIFNVLLQAMDYGTLTDNAGKKADFRNVIIIMTSNAGAREAGKKAIGFDENITTAIDAVQKAVEKIFPPEFRNRLDEIVPFNPVNAEMAEKISGKAISELAEKASAKGVSVIVSDEAVKFIATKGLSKTYGAREIIRVVDKEIKKQLADAMLFSEQEATSFEITIEGGIIKVVPNIKEE